MNFKLQFAICTYFATWSVFLLFKLPQTMFIFFPIWKRQIFAISSFALIAEIAFSLKVCTKWSMISTMNIVILLIWSIPASAYHTDLITIYPRLIWICTAYNTYHPLHSLDAHQKWSLKFNPSKIDWIPPLCSLSKEKVC